ncbi:hypothetical protein ARMSODRAFT_1056513 [Armillaria solidipes]|uniref:Uncharacterized protein n=1 Tax=Armillaria solidipes TaxID=1076256 RepID=A0A2H3B2U1_9AGAR|nr:hypothetical protein ARMSODRAFT_1056513 [Armillaria solidipes]
MDSRFDDIDSKLEDIDMDVLMGGIDDAIRETLDESLDFERMAAMNHDTDVYHAVKDKRKPITSSNAILIEVPFPAGEEPTSLSRFYQNTAVINGLGDNKHPRYYEGIILEKSYYPESRDKRMQAIWHASRRISLVSPPIISHPLPAMPSCLHIVTGLIQTVGAPHSLGMIHLPKWRAVHA